MFQLGTKFMWIDTDGMDDGHSELRCTDLHI